VPAGLGTGRAGGARADAHGIEAGVIDDARRRQHRRRRVVAAAVVAVATVAAGAIAPVWGGGSGGTASAQPTAPTRPLTGPPLGTTHLRLIVADTPPTILDVDSGTLTAVPGVVPGPATTLATPQVMSVARAGGGAFAIVDERCRHVLCLAGYLIGADGSARRVATGTNMLAEPDAAAAWVLRGSGRAGCTLRLVPGAGSPLRVPCGSLDGATADEVLIATGRGAAVVDVAGGRVRTLAVPSGVAVNLVGDDLVLESNTLQQFDGGRGELSLVDLSSGGRRAVAYPTMPRRVGSDYFNLQRIAVEPHGRLVALTFVDPWFPPAQAAYIWILDTRTGRLALLPGFPVQEGVKFSDAEWTDDDRLVVVSLDPLGGNRARAVIGVWTPGQRTLPVRTIPAGTGGGYWEFAAQTR